MVRRFRTGISGVPLIYLTTDVQFVFALAVPYIEHIHWRFRSLSECSRLSRMQCASELAHTMVLFLVECDVHPSICNNTPVISINNTPRFLVNGLAIRVDVKDEW